MEFRKDCWRDQHMTEELRKQIGLMN